MAGSDNSSPRESQRGSRQSSAQSQIRPDRETIDLTTRSTPEQEQVSDAGLASTSSRASMRTPAAIDSARGRGSPVTPSAQRPTGRTWTPRTSSAQQGKWQCRNSYFARQTRGIGRGNAGTVRAESSAATSSSLRTPTGYRAASTSTGSASAIQSQSGPYDPESTSGSSAAQALIISDSSDVECMESLSTPRPPPRQQRRSGQIRVKNEEENPESTDEDEDVDRVWPLARQGQQNYGQMMIDGLGNFIGDDPALSQIIGKRATPVFAERQFINMSDEKFCLNNNFLDSYIAARYRTTQSDRDDPCDQCLHDRQHGGMHPYDGCHSNSKLADNACSNCIAKGIRHRCSRVSRTRIRGVTHIKPPPGRKSDYDDQKRRRFKDGDEDDESGCFGVAV
ncbi:hypothetical protein DL769_001922 [Monosporascus sp. CRB-8-3]|nr:hypothetical protein DL769_001922 [Monosporascus sp. CRB-8-3]